MRGREKRIPSTTTYKQGRVSQPRRYVRPGVGDHPLKHWKSVGLRHPSTVRISNILAIERKLIKRVLGTLHSEDLGRVVLGLRETFGMP